MSWTMSWTESMNHAVGEIQFAGCTNHRITETNSYTDMAKLYQPALNTCPEPEHKNININ